MGLRLNLWPVVVCPHRVRLGHLFFHSDDLDLILSDGLNVSFEAQTISLVHLYLAIFCAKTLPQQETSVLTHEF
jgi:hypothetical protein